MDPLILKSEVAATDYFVRPSARPYVCVSVFVYIRHDGYSSSEHLWNSEINIKQVLDRSMEV